MRTVHVVGTSGSGKSALARRLAASGQHAISTDGVAGLCRWVDGQGWMVDRPDDPTAAWLNAHRWVWDADRFDSLLDEARTSHASTVYICGSAANDDEFADRFDLVVLLDIDEATMVRRVREAARGNDFGRCGDSLTALIDWLPSIRARYLRRADVVIDATGDLDTVVAAVVGCGRRPHRC